VDLDRLASKIEASQERILRRIKSKPVPVDGLNSAPGYSPNRWGSCWVTDDAIRQQTAANPSGFLPFAFPETLRAGHAIAAVTSAAAAPRSMIVHRYAYGGHCKRRGAMQGSATRFCNPARPHVVTVPASTLTEPI